MKLDISNEGWSALKLTLLAGCFLVLFSIRSECRADPYERVSRCTDGKIIIYVPKYTCPAGFWKI